MSEAGAVKKKGGGLFRKLTVVIAYARRTGNCRLWNLAPPGVAISKIILGTKKERDGCPGIGIVSKCNTGKNPEGGGEDRTLHFVPFTRP